MEGFGSDGIVFPDGEGGDLRPPGELSVAGYMPLLVDSQWRNAVLLNSATYDGEAWALYRDERLPARVGYRKWSERYPEGEPAENAMPMANRAVTWGDFLVLGDIVWRANPSNPLNAGNAARYPHGLWFSEPGRTDSWDPIEVQFVGQRSGGNRIVGMFPMEAGLLVASTSGMTLLRGTPVDHEPVDLRVGLGPSSAEEVVFWPQTGSVVWLDRLGQVWQTNGEQFSRIDQPLPDMPPVTPDSPRGPGAVAVWDNYLVLVRAGRTFVLRALSDRGAWTELNAGVLRELAGYRGSLWGRSESGLFRFGPSVVDQRGQLDRVPVESRVETRTLPGSDPHEKAFWHRFGARTTGGTLVGAWSKTGPALSDVTALSYDVGAVSSGRDLRVWPAHGPSTEASFGVLGEGDITYESFTAWVHQGRPSR